MIFSIREWTYINLSNNPSADWTLNLASNNLKSLPENSFIFQFNLRLLFLAHNELTKLDAKEFKNLKKLEVLALSSNPGTNSAVETDEKATSKCNTDRNPLPDFIRYNEDRAPTCFLE